MPVITEKYTPGKISMIHQILTVDHANGEPREYEVWVDDLKITQRTSDPERFFMHEEFINADTHSISVVLFNPGNSRRNTRYILVLKESAKEGLSGIEIENTITEKVLLQKKAWEAELKDKEIERLTKELKASEEYAEKLEKTILEMKESKGLAEANWGNILGSALEGFVKRNPSFLGGAGLAGLFSQDKTAKSPQLDGAPAQEQSELSDDDKLFVGMGRELRKAFNEVEIALLIDILVLSSEDKEALQPILQYLNKRKQERDTAQKAKSTEKKDQGSQNTEQK